MKKAKPKHQRRRKGTMKGLRRPRSQAERDVRDPSRRALRLVAMIFERQ